MGEISSPISYKFVAAAALTASKTLLYRMTPQRAGGASLGERVSRSDTPGSASIGVNPSDALGRAFQTDLSLGTGENADDLVITDAVCTVEVVKTIVTTVLTGLAGTIKESISAGDYRMEVAVGLVATQDGKIVDEYPAEGVQMLRKLFDRPEALYVNSDFLRLFDITRLVITEYKIEQMTHSNRQIVTFKAISDEDYQIKYNEY